MHIESKAEAFERIMSQKKPLCPHCDKEMSLWEVPEINFSDGLGWGEPYLFVCFNDDCKLFKEGWDDLLEQVGHISSYRCMNYPGTEKFELMPVFSQQGGQGQVIDDQSIAEEEALKQAMKNGFSKLADCYVDKDSVQILKILIDATEPVRVRLKAAEMIGDVGETDVIDSLRYYKYGHQKIVKQVEESINNIHKRCFTKECPYCAEIIKERAKICKHCSKEL